ncbi:hypothetical protein SteCoe_834 [Stentor coeruleus]|uniref:Uncharacterized protein n=1 Tax=Stentor coeruleus TaxID=5963 RepID=A0A1R2D3B6_9CILI|nr:hypothetical protein SteCoe_834 [Stentor coeruleus]
MAQGFCVSYCMIMSLAGFIILTYLGFLCLFDVEELKVEERKHQYASLFIAAAIYFFTFIVSFGIKIRKGKVHVADYQPLNAE